MLRQFSKRVYYSDPAEETDRPVLGYIAGERYSLMIDAGNSPCHVEDFYCGLDEQGLKRPDFVVLTHSHWDHSFGLCRTGAVSISCRETAEELGKLSSVEWNLERLEKAVEAGLIPLFCREHILKEYPDLSRIKVVRPDICFEEELALDLGGATCLLKKLVSPHRLRPLAFKFQILRAAPVFHKKSSALVFCVSGSEQPVISLLELSWKGRFCFSFYQPRLPAR